VEFDFEAALTHAGVDDAVERKSMRLELEQLVETEAFRKDRQRTVEKLEAARGSCKFVDAAHHLADLADLAEIDGDNDKPTTDEEDLDSNLPTSSLNKQIHRFDPSKVDYSEILVGLSPTEFASKRTKIESLITTKRFLADPEYAVIGILADVKCADVSGYVSAIKTKYYEEKNADVFSAASATVTAREKAISLLSDDDDDDGESTKKKKPEEKKAQRPGLDSMRASVKSIMAAVAKRKTPSSPSAEPPTKKKPAAAAAAAAAAPVADTAPTPAAPAPVPVPAPAPAPVADPIPDRPAKRARTDTEKYDPIDPLELPKSWYTRHVRDADQLVYWFVITRQPTPHLRYVQLADSHYAAVAKRVMGSAAHALLYNRYRCGILDLDNSTATPYIGDDPVDTLALWETVNRSASPMLTSRVVIACDTQNLSAKMLFLKEWDRLRYRVFNFLKVPKNVTVLSMQTFKKPGVPTALANGLGERLKEEAKARGVEAKVACVMLAHEWIAARLKELHVRDDVRAALGSILAEDSPEDLNVVWGHTQRIYTEFYELHHRVTEHIRVISQAEYETVFWVGFADWPSAWHMYVYLKAHPTGGAPTTASGVTDAAAAAAAAAGAGAGVAAAIAAMKDLVNGIDVAHTYSGAEAKSLVETSWSQFVASLATVTECIICTMVDKTNHNIYPACGHSYCTDCVAQCDKTNGIKSGHLCPGCRTSSPGKLLTDYTKENLVKALYHRNDWRRRRTTAELGRASDETANTEAAKREARDFLQRSLNAFRKTDQPMTGYQFGGISRAALSVVIAELKDPNISVDIYASTFGAQPVLRCQRGSRSTVFSSLSAPAAK
jgi:hypothetical protein